MLFTLVTFFHIAICVLLIIIVLLQHTRGADMGATFGGGSNTLFGASGADNLLTRVTTVMALLFMLSSVYLSSNMRSGSGTRGTLFEGLPKTAPVAPAATDAAAPASADAPAAPAGEAAPAAANGTTEAAKAAADQALAPPASEPVAPPPSDATSSAPQAAVPQGAQAVAVKQEVVPVEPQKNEAPQAPASGEAAKQAETK